MLVALAFICLPPCSSAEEVELCSDPWTSISLTCFRFFACEGRFFFFHLTPSFLNCSGMIVYDSLFLCACLLRVYRCVRAFQLCININWLPLYYQKGLKLQTANNILSVETKYVLAHIYCCTVFQSSANISYELVISSWPIKEPVPNEMHVCCLCVKPEFLLRCCV